MSFESGVNLDYVFDFAWFKIELDILMVTPVAVMRTDAAVASLRVHREAFGLVLSIGPAAVDVANPLLSRAVDALGDVLCCLDLLIVTAHFYLAVPLTTVYQLGIGLCFNDCFGDFTLLLD